MPDLRTQIVLDADHFERVMGELMGQLERRDQELLGALSAAVAKGVVEGQRAALKDDELQEHYWSVAFKHLSTQAHDNVSKSIGRKFLSWLSIALLSAAVTVAALNVKGS